METTLINIFEGGNFEQTYQSPILNNGDFNYRIYVQLLDMSQVSDMDGFTVDVLVAKTVDSITDEQLHSLADTYDMSEDEVSDWDVCEYGYKAIIDGHKGYIEFQDEAVEIAAGFIEKLDMYESMLGFYLDNSQNRIGNTGWDFLAGKIGF